MEFLPGENVEFLTALGRFTVRFAAAESGLDVCNALIFRFCEGRTVEPKIPRFLERKLARACTHKRASTPAQMLPFRKTPTNHSVDDTRRLQRRLQAARPLTLDHTRPLQRPL
jgi:hypothetical protein